MFAVAHRKDVVILALQTEAFDHQPIVHFLTQKKGLAIRAHDASSIGVQKPPTRRMALLPSRRSLSQIIMDCNTLSYLSASLKWNTSAALVKLSTRLQ